jgi:hypothetical protein
MNGAARAAPPRRSEFAGDPPHAEWELRSPPSAEPTFTPPSVTCEVGAVLRSLGGAEIHPSD